MKKMGFFTRIYCKICRWILIAGMYILFRPKKKYIDKNQIKEAKKKPAVIIANHTSLYDAIFVLATMSGHRAWILTAKDWYEKPFFGTIIAGNRCIPIDRAGLDTEWIRECTKVLKAGDSVIIFPEGHREKQGTLDEFKSGFTMLAKMNNVPIISVCLSGRYKKFIGERKKLLVDSPMELSEGAMTADYLKAESERFRQRMFELLEESDRVFNRGKRIPAENN
ncbi:MAG: 1-acyl-sn-glycerol-3-phosphate acyltransferase [Lachnospiraceae bacterium]|nr:1-acyl-sn-glycerol-3-phosphate acyltransferase [Lachnospiraceae bacterium]